MNISDKIAYLRKREGWSQEELGNKLDISRQSVSKWESGASLPDIDNIVRLSEIFEVSTDYLLKDESEDIISPYIPATFETDYTEKDRCEDIRHVSGEDADTYTSLVRRTAGKLAFGVSLCIVSPVTLLMLGTMAELGGFGENMAVGIGIAVLLAFVAVAVAIFILNGMPLDKYAFLEKEMIYVDSATYRRVQEMRDEYMPTYRRNMTVGVVLCIVGVIPLMLSLSATSPKAVMVSVCLILIFVSAGVNLLVRSGSIEDAFKKLLQEGDYSPEKKAIGKKLDLLPPIYWCSVTAIYLAVSFYLSNWDRSWIIWPVAGVLFAAVYGVASVIAAKRQK